MATGHYFLKWRVEVCLLPDGAGQMQAPMMQTEVINNDFGANGGLIAVPGGSTPTGANFTTACTTLGTNISTAINVAATLAAIQGFATGATP